MKHILLLFLLIVTALPVHAALTVSTYGYNESCGNADGWASCTASGGVSPYTYAWSTGETTTTIYNLAAGTYSITVTDDVGAQVTDQVTITNDLSLIVPWPSQLVNGAGGHPCPGQCNGTLMVNVLAMNGQPPYTVTIDGAAPAFTDQDNNPVFTGFCAGQQVLVWVADALGCSGQTNYTVTAPEPTNAQLVQVEGACSGGANGTVTLDWDDPAQIWAQYIGLELLDAQQQDVLQGSNNLITYTPPSTFGGLAPGTYTARFTQQVSSQPCYEDVPFTIPDLGPVCGNVSGTLYIDNDQDCVRDPSEAGVPYRVLEFQPGPEYAITDQDGTYARNMPLGNFTAEVLNSPDLLPLCPATTPVPFALTALQPLLTLDLADSSTVPMDLEVQLAVNTLRPGFTSGAWVRVRNATPQLTGLVTLSLTLDPTLVYVSAVPTPTAIVGNVLTWSLGAFAAYQEEVVSLQVQTPLGTALGTLVSTTAECSAALPEVDVSNNVIVEQDVVTGSYDPNDKTVRTSTGWSDTQYIIGDDAWLDYTVRFQNTGTDTAFTVVISDTLEADLDMGTFEQGVASHPFTVSFKPGRVVEWRFASILLPDSNTNEPLSHGLATFRIRPVQPVLPGTEYRNNADIFFDFNPPVRTNDAVVVAETSTSLQLTVGSAQRLCVFPNPVNDELGFSMPIGAGPYRVEVIGADGRLYLTKRTDDPTVDVSALPAGLYTIRVNGSTSRFAKR